MNTSQMALYDRLTRIQRLLDSRSAQLAQVSRGNVRDELDAIVLAIPREQAARLAATIEAHELTERLRELREELRVCHIAPLVAVAQARTPRTPALRALQMPPKNASIAELITTALSIALAADEDREAFVRQSLPDDFVEQALAAVGEIRDAVEQADRARLAGAEATAALARLTKQGRDVASVLDALVLANASADRALLAEWRAANSSRRHSPGRRASHRS